ncbi:MAG: hypothetical protein KKA65_05590 [Nanoarchaeota archaeon]|nr:hypothetical protein [Nanoarchaeota archaeon]MBU4352434.1 hypothetical protein [Nanoarchaeota archaeon]MBU4456943.1 hypothetical protein [Nanoarchaeota archaeon]
MRSIIKLLKHSKVFRLIFLACIMLIIIATVYRTNYTIKDYEVDYVNNLEACLVSMDLPKTHSECLIELALTEDNKAIKNILRLSKDSKLKGYAYIIKEDYAKAQEELNNVLVENHLDTEARKALIFVHMNLQEVYGVIDHCTIILENNPEDTFCLDAQGISYYLLDENEKAVQNADKSFELEPTFCHEFNIGLFQGGIGNIEETKSVIDKLITQDKTKILKCWSPIKMEIPDDKIDGFDICFLNKQKDESVCRGFAKEGWKTKLQGVEMPEPVFSM